jgi:hypothetical protein
MRHRKEERRLRESGKQICGDNEIDDLSDENDEEDLDEIDGSRFFIGEYEPILEKAVIDAKTHIVNEAYDRDGDDGVVTAGGKALDLLELEEDRVIMQLLNTPLFCGDEDEVVLQLIREDKIRLLIHFLMQHGKHETALEIICDRWAVYKVFMFLVG